MGRDDAADDDHRVAKTQFAKRSFQGRHEREVARGERRDADDMNLGFGRKRRDFFRGCEQRADLDLESEVREGRGDDLLSAIMAILAHFGDEDPRSVAFVLGEGAGHRDHTVGRLLAGPASER